MGEIIIPQSLIETSNVRIRLSTISPDGNYLLVGCWLVKMIQVDAIGTWIELYHGIGLGWIHYNIHDDISYYDASY